MPPIWNVEDPPLEGWNVGHEVTLWRYHGITVKNA